MDFVKDTDSKVIDPSSGSNHHRTTYQQISIANGYKDICEVDTGSLNIKQAYNRAVYFRYVHPGLDYPFEYRRDS